MQVCGYQELGARKYGDKLVHRGFGVMEMSWDKMKMLITQHCKCTKCH